MAKDLREANFQLAMGMSGIVRMANDRRLSQGRRDEALKIWDRLNQVWHLLDDQGKA